MNLRDVAETCASVLLIVGTAAIVVVVVSIAYSVVVAAIKAGKDGRG